MLQLDYFETISQAADPEATGPLRTMLDRAVHRVERDIVPLLPLPHKIVIAAGTDRARVIPETGISARAWSNDRIDVWVDPRNAWVEAAGEEELVAMLAHELHHCARWTRPGYGSTLSEAIVSEGLACHFEATFRGGVAPFWARALDEPTLRRVEAQALELFDSRHYDHRAWFGGAAGGDDGRGPERSDRATTADSPWAVPRHAGHTLGYRITARYLRRTGRSAAQLVHAPAHVFFD